MYSASLEAGYATTAAAADHDTTAINRGLHDFTDVESVWLFGYGSLIYKVDFPWLERRPATIHGWSRRLWQGSHDHRGTPEHPGRVATLVPAADASCVGMAYRVAPATFEQLDYREKNGYLRLATTLEFGDGACATGLVYIADADNAAWLGQASEAEIADQVAAAVGPSGPNRDYVLFLVDALRELGVVDPHLSAVANACALSSNTVLDGACPLPVEPGKPLPTAGSAVRVTTSA